MKFSNSLVSNLKGIVGIGGQLKNLPPPLKSVHGDDRSQAA